MASERGSAKPACWLYVPDTGGDAGGAGIALRIDPGADALKAKLDGLEKAAAWLAKALADPELPPAARRGLENFSLGGMGFKSAPVDDGEDDLEEYAAERGVLTCTGEVFNPSAVQALLPDEGEEIARLHPDDAGDSPCFLDASGNVPKLVFDVPAAGNGDEYGWHRATVDLPELRQALQQPLARMRAAESARQNLVDAVRQDGMNLQDVPEGMRTPEVCLETVRQDGLALHFVPDRLKTLEVCRAAVERDGRALAFVPKDMRDHAMCLAAVSAGGDDVIFSVPERHRSEGVCLLSCDPARWTVPWAAARRTAEALPRCFFRKDGAMKRDLVRFFSQWQTGRDMLARLQTGDGQFCRLKKHSWAEDEALEKAAAAAALPACGEQEAETECPAP